LRHLAQQRRERLLVAGVGRLADAVVDAVQLLRGVVVDAPLTLPHHADDHCPPSSSFFGSPVPISAFIFASWSSTCDPSLSWANWRWSSPRLVVKSSSAPEAVSSSIAFARACICSVLSFARWIAI